MSSSPSPQGHCRQCPCHVQDRLPLLGHGHQLHISLLFVLRQQGAGRHELRAGKLTVPLSLPSRGLFFLTEPLKDTQLVSPIISLMLHIFFSPTLPNTSLSNREIYPRNKTKGSYLVPQKGNAEAALFHRNRSHYSDSKSRHANHDRYARTTIVIRLTIP